MRTPQTSAQTCAATHESGPRREELAHLHLPQDPVSCLACEVPTCWARRSAEGTSEARTAVHALLVPAVSQSGGSAGRGLHRLVKQRRHPRTRPAAQLTVIVPQVAARVFRRTGAPW